MKLLSLLLFIILSLTTQAQNLVLHPEVTNNYVQELVIPVSTDTYVVLKDSTAYVYKVDAVLPYKKQNLNNSDILDLANNRLYNVALIPEYFEQLNDSTSSLLVSNKYDIRYRTVDSITANTLFKTYGYFPPPSISEAIPFNKTMQAEDFYAASINDASDNLALPSHYIRVDKDNVLSVLNNGYLVLSEAKNNKVTQKKSWGNFNGTLSLQRSVKIGDFARLTFERYKENIDTLETFWSILDLTKQIFVPINLEQFYAHLENLEEQDINLLNSTPLFYRALNNNNIRMYVLPANNFVWVDDQSYYYGSKDLSKYATLNKDDINYNLNVHAHIYDHPARILRAIAPQEKEKIKSLSKTYELKKDRKN